MTDREIAQVTVKIRDARKVPGKLARTCAIYIYIYIHNARRRNVLLAADFLINPSLIHRTDLTYIYIYTSRMGKKTRAHLMNNFCRSFSCLRACEPRAISFSLCGSIVLQARVRQEGATGPGLSLCKSL